MRDRAANPPTTTTQHHGRQQRAESELGFVSHLKNSLSIALRGARRLGALPKTCHLLPSTAICSRKTATPVSTVPFLSAPRGRAGQPWPRAENRERGREEPRCKAVTEGHLSHDRRIRQQSENAARLFGRGGYVRREVGVEQRHAGTDLLPLGRRTRSAVRNRIDPPPRYGVRESEIRGTTMVLSTCRVDIHRHWFST